MKNCPLRRFIHADWAPASPEHEQGRLLVALLLVMATYTGLQCLFFAFATLFLWLPVIILGASTAYYVALLVGLVRYGWYRLGSLGLVAGTLAGGLIPVLLTGGLFASPLLPVLLLPVTMAFFLGMVRLGTALAFGLPLLGLLQLAWEAIAGALPVISFPGSRARQDSIIANLSAYGLMLSMLVVFEIVSTRLRRERDAERQRLRYLALHDHLTGLTNRRHFTEQLEAACRRADRTRQPLALLFIDLDHFKMVNDQCGHHVGDALLCELANRLRDALRRTDIPSRLGGDEFAILLEQAQPGPSLDMLVEKINRAVRAPVTIGEQTLHMTASIGVAFYPHDAQTATGLLSAADAAMYRRKQARRRQSGAESDGTPV